MPPVPPSIAVVVNSCASFFDRTLPPLLDSLDAAGVPKGAVHVVVGDCARDEDLTYEGVAVHRRRYANIDNNGLLWLAFERPDEWRNGLDGAAPDWVFYTHDTALVAPQFWDECRRVAKEARAGSVCVKLHEPFSMSMGFYKTEWLWGDIVRVWARTIANFDNSEPAKQAIKANLAAVEDACFNLAPPTAIEVLPNAYTVVDRFRTMYGSNVPRIVEYYATPGIYKVKANFTAAKLHIKL